MAKREKMTSSQVDFVYDHVYAFLCVSVCLIVLMTHVHVGVGGFKEISHDYNDEIRACGYSLWFVLF